MTKVVIGLMIAGFLAANMGAPLLRWLGFNPCAFPQAITGLFTYPFVFGPGDLLGIIFGGLILYWFGGSLERSWGPRNFVLFLLAANIAAAVVWALGVFLLVRPPVAESLFPGYAVYGAWFMLSSVIVAWAWLNPDATILLFFVLPIRAKWIGWLDIILLYVLMPLGVMRPHPLIPLLGLFALGGVGVAYLYTEYQRKWGWIPRKKKTPPAQRPRLRLSSSSWWARVTRPVREWQRRRRVAHLQRTIKFDD